MYGFARDASKAQVLLLACTAERSKGRVNDMLRLMARGIADVAFSSPRMRRECFRLQSR